MTARKPDPSSPGRTGLPGLPRAALGCKPSNPQWSMFVLRALFRMRELRVAASRVQTTAHAEFQQHLKASRAFAEAARRVAAPA